MSLTSSACTAIGAEKTTLPDVAPASTSLSLSPHPGRPAATTSATNAILAIEDCSRNALVLHLAIVASDRFDWVRRMGVHEAYHLDPTNRIVHWVCIPLELAALLKLLFVIPAPVDLGLIAIAAVAAVYLAADVVAGGVMTLLLLALWAAVVPLGTGSVALDVAIAAVVFLVAFAFQTRIGHVVFERGVDDTEMNLADFRRTRNPIPLLLVFYYHAVELLFALGYRPAQRAAMERHRDAELARIVDDDPRRPRTEHDPRPARIGGAPRRA